MASHQGEGAATAAPITVLCQWFALCENEATDAEFHPILGHVPICARCKAKLARIG